MGRDLSEIQNSQRGGQRLRLITFSPRHFGQSKKNKSNINCFIIHNLFKKIMKNTKSHRTQFDNTLGNHTFFTVRYSDFKNCNIINVTVGS